MPTDCDPWPGKTNATLPISSSSAAAAGASAHRPWAGRRDDTPAKRGPRLNACRHARIVPTGYAAAMTERARGAERSGLSPEVAAAGSAVQNPLQLSDRIAMGQALWRDLVIGFAAQLGELRLGFTQLAALYAAAGTRHADHRRPGRHASAAPIGRDVADRLRARGARPRRAPRGGRRSAAARGRGDARRATRSSGSIDGARAEQFLAVVRPLPAQERALVAMGVAALASRAVTRRGRLIKAPREGA